MQTRCFGGAFYSLPFLYHLPQTAHLPKLPIAEQWTRFAVQNAWHVQLALGQRPRFGGSGR